jgi:hypothetical protein
VPSPLPSSAVRIAFDRRANSNIWLRSTGMVATSGFTTACGSGASTKRTGLYVRAHPEPGSRPFGSQSLAQELRNASPGALAKGARLRRRYQCPVSASAGSLRCAASDTLLQLGDAPAAQAGENRMTFVGAYRVSSLDHLRLRAYAHARVIRSSAVGWLA